jgi:hypothetical protein
VDLCNFPHQALEWCFVNQKFCAFLILTNFTEGNSARTIAIRLLDSAGRRGRLTSRLGRKQFSGSFASSKFASSLFGASHAV